MGAPRAIALCNTFGGYVKFLRGDLQGAVRSLIAGLEIYRDLEASSGEAISLQMLGVVYTALGEMDLALTRLKEALAAAERGVLRTHLLTRTYATLARNRLAVGDLDEAARFLEQGNAEAERHGNCITCAALLLPEAVRVRIAQEDLEAAEREVAALETTATTFKSRAWIAMARRARGQWLCASGEKEQAAHALKEAEEAFSSFGFDYEAAMCQLARSRAVNPGECEALQASAGEILSRLGAQRVDDFIQKSI